MSDGWSHEEGRCICSYGDEALYVEPGCPIHAPGCSVERCADTPLRHCCGADHE